MSRDYACMLPGNLHSPIAIALLESRRSPVQSRSALVRSNDLPVAETETVSEPARAWGGPLLTLTWFGFLTGWLELGWFLSRTALHLRLPRELVRTNRHFVWMVPVSDVLIFAAVGLALV